MLVPVESSGVMIFAVFLSLLKDCKMQAFLPLSIKMQGKTKGEICSRSFLTRVEAKPAREAARENKDLELLSEKSSISSPSFTGKPIVKASALYGLL